MMVTPPDFVGRHEELNTVFTKIKQSATGGEFIAVTGPPGHGKRTLVEEVMDQYQNSTETRVLHFPFHSGLGNLRQFAQAFEGQWKEDIENRGVSGIISKISGKGVSNSRVTEVGLSITPFTIKLKGNDGHSKEDNKSVVSDVIEKLEEFNRIDECDQLLLVFSGYENIEQNRESFNRLFKALATTLPENVTVILSCIERGFLSSYESNVTEIPLEEFSESEVKEYLQDSGFDTNPELTQKLREATGGNPYYLNRLVQSAESDDLGEVVEQLPDSDHREVYNYIESAFIDNLSDSQREFLYSTCVLQELRADTVAELFDIPLQEAEDQLRNLRNKSVIREMGVHEGIRVYLPHALLRNHIYTKAESGQRDEIRTKHRRCAKIYAERVAKDRWKNRVSEFVDAVFSEGEIARNPVRDVGEMLGEYYTLGLLFDMHISESVSGDNYSKEAAEIIKSVDDTETALISLSMFYRTNDMEDIFSEISSQVSQDYSVDLEKRAKKATTLSEAQREILDCFAEIREVEVDNPAKPYHELEQLNKVQDRIRVLLDNPEVDQLAGVIMIAIYLMEGSIHKSIAENNLDSKSHLEKGEEVSENLHDFTRDFWNISEKDKEYAKLALKSVKGRISTPRLVSDISEPDVNFDDLMSRRGLIGGLQRGMGVGFTELFFESLEKSRDNNAMMNNFKILVKAAVQAAERFEDHGHPDIAKVLRDLGRIFTVYQGTGQSLNRQGGPEMVETKLFRQAQSIIISL